MTSDVLTLLRPPASGRRDTAFPESDGTTTSTTVDSPISTTLGVVDPTVSLYVTAPGVRPVRIHPLHHRPRHPAPYIPIEDRLPEPRIIDGPTQRTDPTYEDFLILEPTLTIVDVATPAVVS